MVSHNVRLILCLFFLVSYAQYSLALHSNPVVAGYSARTSEQLQKWMQIEGARIKLSPGYYRLKTTVKPATDVYIGSKTIGAATVVSGEETGLLFDLSGNHNLQLKGVNFFNHSQDLKIFNPDSVKLTNDRFIFSASDIYPDKAASMLFEGCMGPVHMVNNRFDVIPEPFKLGFSAATDKRCLLTLSHNTFSSNSLVLQLSGVHSMNSHCNRVENIDGLTCQSEPDSGYIHFRDVEQRDFFCGKRPEQAIHCPMPESIVPAYSSHRYSKRQTGDVEVYGNTTTPSEPVTAASGFGVFIGVGFVGYAVVIGCFVGIVISAHTWGNCCHGNYQPVN